MIQIDTRSPVPIYDQIKAGFRGLVNKGLLRSGDRAPSVRALAASLRVNPNTVARAFRELALEGFLVSKRGEGNVISGKAKRQAKAGPVIVTDRGKPSHVLLSFDEYRNLTEGHRSLVDMIAMKDGGEIDFEAPRSRELGKAADFT